MKFITAALVTLFLLTSVANANKFCPNPHAVAQHFGSVEGEQGFVSRFDMNGDGAVTVGDIIIAGNCWLERR
ncbi:MAG: hypothetical protein IH933_14425 [Euryarchaeota archaeon]|nr:hypothetical protein [Euryarchaeota archaeon]